MTLLEVVLTRLHEEYEHAGRGEVFLRLKEVLTGEKEALPYAMIAADLGISEAAIQAAVYRLRKRYAALVREEIAATVAQPSDVEDEILDLFTALGS